MSTKEELEKAEIDALVATFGKDHASVLLYCMSRVVDSKGKLDDRRMRTFVYSKKYAESEGGWEYTTVLRGYKKHPNDKHDDWDCLSELEFAGYVEYDGGSIVAMTDKGWLAAFTLLCRKAMHLAAGEWDWDPLFEKLRMQP